MNDLERSLDELGAKEADIDQRAQQQHSGRTAEKGTEPDCESC